MESVKWETAELNYFQQKMIKLSILLKEQRGKAGKKPKSSKCF